MRYQPTFAECPSDADAVLNSVKPDLRSHRILVVDDDAALRDVYTMLLQLEGCEVETAKDGLDGLDRLANKNFDVLITDRNMPRLDGVGLIQRVRQQGNHIPIIMVSGSLKNSALPNEVASEVVVALPKPTHPRQLIAAIAFALRDSSDDESHTAASPVRPSISSSTIATPSVTHAFDERGLL